ncbi:hypothetical protein DSLASN_20230 [Desulfoluna limicola]|uniref:Uncharacterized protein n=1 Tax=Desulfoluna limicola TaxID=2810562 RepID=A0ABN6F451_9BACT|nr:hypothetical protein [Desulfoluna limicola]BCS96391.1 hypothetical protein DSLASN_20230 [Desulfoluna limicola]
METQAENMKDAAVRYFEEHPLEADTQTRISLFLINLKQANAMQLAKNEFQPMDWLPYTLLHRQYFKEMELLTLLHRSTQWSLNPFTYMDASQISMKFWSRINAYQFMTNGLSQDRSFFEYLALSHAFMAEVRFVPLFSTDYSLENQFYAALYAIENENGRQIQTQIRFLKEMELPLTRNEKEEIVDEKRRVVADLFSELLASVCQSTEPALNWASPLSFGWPVN